MKTIIILMLLGVLVLTEEAQGIQIQNQVLTESSSQKKSRMRSKDDILGGQMLSTYSMSQNVMQDNWNDVTHRVAKGKWFLPEFFSWISCSIFQCATPSVKPDDQVGDQPPQSQREQQQQPQQVQQSSQSNENPKNEGSGGDGGNQPSGDSSSAGGSSGGGSSAGGSSGGGSSGGGSSGGGSSAGGSSAGGSSGGGSSGGGSSGGGSSGGGSSGGGSSAGGSSGGGSSGGGSQETTVSPFATNPTNPAPPANNPNPNNLQPAAPGSLEPVAQGSTSIKTRKATKGPAMASKSVRGSEDGVGDEEIDKNIVKYDNPKDDDASSLAHMHHHHKQERHQNIYKDQFYVQKSNQTSVQKPLNGTK